MNPETEEPKENAVEYAPGGNPDWEEIYKVRNAIYEEQGRIPLSECTGEVVGERFVITHQGKEIWNDHRMCGYAERAWEILSGRPAKWKTFGLYRTMRQAVREHAAQMMQVEELPRGASRHEIEEYLIVTRHFDKRHHGTSTF